MEITETRSVRPVCHHAARLEPRFREAQAEEHSKPAVSERRCGKPLVVVEGTYKCSGRERDGKRGKGWGEMREVWASPEASIGTTEERIILFWTSCLTDQIPSDDCTVHLLNVGKWSYSKGNCMRFPGWSTLISNSMHEKANIIDSIDKDISKGTVWSCYSRPFLNSKIQLDSMVGS